MNPEEIGKFLETYDYDYFINDALSRIPEGVDTREGSIIFDALGPACYQLAEFVMQLKLMYQATFIHTAHEEYLDLRVAERGLKRYLATKAMRLGYFEGTDGKAMSDSHLIGSRFSTLDATQFLAFQVTEATQVPGYFHLECETEGTIGNAYRGDLLPLTHLNGLGKAELTEIIIPGQDVETDESLRARFFKSLEISSFGGNIAQYKEQLLAIDGVGAVQVHPAWNGGGTVKCVVVDGEYHIISNSFIESIQNQVDPQKAGHGYGLAPIGHQVTVTTPTLKSVNVTVFVDLQPGVTLGQIQDLIVEAIQSHFQNLRTHWAVENEFSEYSLSAYRSQIMVAVLQVEGVVNVSQILLNGQEQDIVFEQTGDLQELPMVGSVVVHD